MWVGEDRAAQGPNHQAGPRDALKAVTRRCGSRNQETCGINFGQVQKEACLFRCLLPAIIENCLIHLWLPKLICVLGTGGDGSDSAEPMARPARFLHQACTIKALKAN